MLVVALYFLLNINELLIKLVVVVVVVVVVDVFLHCSCLLIYIMCFSCIEFTNY